LVHPSQFSKAALLTHPPNGDLMTANGDSVNPDDSQPSELVEFTPHGRFVGEFSVSADPDGAFGLAVASTEGVLRFAAVNDNANTLDLWTFKTAEYAGGEMDSEDRSGGSSAVKASLASAGEEGSLRGVNDVAALDQWAFATGRRSQADNGFALT
jgi:hypothetical protein